MLIKNLTGADVRNLRDLAGMTQEQLARVAGTKYSGISRFERSGLEELGDEVSGRVKRAFTFIALRGLIGADWDGLPEDSAMTLSERFSQESLRHVDPLSTLWASLTTQERAELYARLRQRNCGALATPGAWIAPFWVEGEFDAISDVLRRMKGYAHMALTGLSESQAAIERLLGSPCPLVRLDTEQDLADFEAGKAYHE